MDKRELKNKPGWLETLWNVNPALAEKAENDFIMFQEALELLAESKGGKTYDELQEFETRIDDLLNRGIYEKQ